MRVLKEAGSVQSASDGKENGPKVHALVPLLLAFNPSPSNAFAARPGVQRAGASGLSTVGSGSMISRSVAPHMLDLGSQVRVLRPESDWYNGLGTIANIHKEGHRKAVVRFDKANDSGGNHEEFALHELVEVKEPTSKDKKAVSSRAVSPMMVLVPEDLDREPEKPESSRTLATEGAAEAATTAPSLRELVAFKNLQASEFQHPQDKVNTQRLSQLVPIEFTLRQLLLPLVEEAGFLENIGRGVQVSAKQAPTINSLAVEAAAQLDMPVPDVFIRSDPRPNAYTFAIQGKRPFVVLTSSLVDLMTDAEIKAVIGHELGHLKCEHSLWITILSILGIGIDVIEMLFPVGLRRQLERGLVEWRRSAELSCDRASLLVAQDENVVMSVLMKLTGGSLKLADELSPEEFALQAEQYEGAAKSSPLGRLILRQDQSQLYPLPILRAREIQKYAKSTEYENLKTNRATAIAFPSK